MPVAHAASVASPFVHSREVAMKSNQGKCILIIATGAALGACSADPSGPAGGDRGGTTEAVGTIALRITLSDGETLSSLGYTLTDATGTIVQSGKSDSPSFELGNVP